MDINGRLAVSYYMTVATINESHKVYLAMHTETKKIFVKKILSVYNLSVYENLYQKPIPGTPKIVLYYEEDGELTLIEEYVQGTSLEDLIKDSKLSLADIKKYMSALCDIMGSLHSLNPPVIHRDIKPSNIIITDSLEVVLLDFNAAKYFSKDETSDTVLIGTHGYAAPEQYGFGSSSPQTDIYALGILFKEMLESINYTDKASLRIIEKCTMMNPKERYSSVSELKQDLQNEIFGSVNNKFTRFLPPGFRSLTIWKMIVAIMGYVFLGVWCFTSEVKNTTPLQLISIRICMFLSFMILVFFTFNYLDVHKYIKPCRSKNMAIRLLSIALIDFAIFSMLFTILLIVETFCL